MVSNKRGGIITPWAWLGISPILYQTTTLVFFSRFTLQHGLNMWPRHPVVILAGAFLAEARDPWLHSLEVNAIDFQSLYQAYISVQMNTTTVATVYSTVLAQRCRPLRIITDRFKCPTIQCGRLTRNEDPISVRLVLCSPVILLAAYTALAAVLCFARM